MKELTYDNLKETGYDGYLLREGAEKIIPVSYTHL